MRAMAAHPPEELAHPAVKGTRIRVYVWDLVVRNTHWVIALAMARSGESQWMTVGRM